MVLGLKSKGEVSKFSGFSGRFEFLQRKCIIVYLKSTNLQKFQPVAGRFYKFCQPKNLAKASLQPRFQRLFPKNAHVIQKILKMSGPKSWQKLQTEWAGIEISFLVPRSRLCRSPGRLLTLTKVKFSKAKLYFVCSLPNFRPLKTYVHLDVLQCSLSQDSFELQITLQPLS